MSKTTEVVFILDRSGSMSGQESDIIGGFNAMLEKQRQSEYSALITTVLFNNSTQTLHDRVPLDQSPSLTASDYCVGGSTALLDAMGETIRHIQSVHKYIRLEDRPSKTLFVIMTDGQENASRRFNNEQIKRMVRELEDEAGWEFLFIGADIDSFAAAHDVGISRSKAFRFSKSTDSFRGGFDAVGSVMYCVAENDEKLQDDDWDILQRIFDEKKKK